MRFLDLRRRFVEQTGYFSIRMGFLFPRLFGAEENRLCFQYDQGSMHVDLIRKQNMGAQDVEGSSISVKSTPARCGFPIPDDHTVSE